MSPIEDFRSQHGTAWYSFVNSELFKAAKLALLQSGPNAAIATIPVGEVTANGVALAANIQGYNACLSDFETQLVSVGVNQNPTDDPADFPGEDIGMPETITFVAPTTPAEPPKTSRKRK